MVDLLDVEVRGGRRDLEQLLLIVRCSVFPTVAFFRVHLDYICAFACLVKRAGVVQTASVLILNLLAVLAGEECEFLLLEPEVLVRLVVLLHRALSTDGPFHVRLSQNHGDLS